jgi:hypothetical protein
VTGVYKEGPSRNGESEAECEIVHPRKVVVKVAVAVVE